jgi:cell division protein FtsI/penicillin-binding protein 2
MLAKKKIKSAGISVARNYLALFVMFIGYAVIIGRLYYLQVAMGEHYQVWAQGLQSFAGDRNIQDRGEIFFSGGQPLAINKDFYYAYASPLNIKDKESASAQVAGMLGLEKNDLLEKFGKDSLYVLLKEKLSDEETQKVNDAKIEGVYAATKKMRYYPQGTVAAQLAGFVDDDGKGRYGLEEYYDEELARGEDLFLNIDYNIQYQAEQMLGEARVRLEAMDGEAIVADPKTGAIIAMAKNPSFDPNNFKEFANKNIEIFKNDSCQTLFEPGSVFKAITMASSLNDGKVTPKTSYYDSGSLTVGPDTIYNYARRSYGDQTMTNVLEHSINTGAAFAQARLGNKPFADYVEKFGIFEKTGIDLPETYSSNAEFKNGRAINYVTASYGQGIWMTSIQLIKAYSAIANGGLLVQPAVVRGRSKDIDDKKMGQVITAETSRTITGMLASVIDNGFGKAAKVPGYTISGKTGTAQMSWSVFNVNQWGYSDKTTQSFIGYFPSNDPKFLIMVKLKAPNASTAEYSALPVFKDLAKYVIYVSQLPPNEEIKTTAKPAVEAAAVSATTTVTGSN